MERPFSKDVAGPAKDQPIFFVRSTVDGPIMRGEGDAVQTHQGACRFLQRSPCLRIGIRPRAYVQPRQAGQDESTRAISVGVRQIGCHLIDVVDLNPTIREGPLAGDGVWNLVRPTDADRGEPPQHNRRLLRSTCLVNPTNA